MMLAIPCRVIGPTDARPVVSVGAGLTARIRTGQERSKEIPEARRLLEEVPRGAGTMLRIALEGSR